MPCPQVRTAAAFPQSGKPGLILYGAPSSRKRLNRQQDSDESLPKKTRHTHDSSLLSFDPGLDLNPVLPKVESAHVDLREHASELRQPLLNVTPPQSNISLAIKHEADCSTGYEALNSVVEPSGPIPNTRHFNWCLEEDSYAPHLSGTLDVQTSVTPSHTVPIPNNTIISENSSAAHQLLQDDLNLSSFLWPAEFGGTHLQGWQSQTTEQGSWSGTTPVDQVHWPDFAPIYAIPGTSDQRVYSDDDYKLSGQCPVPCHHLISPQATGDSDLQYHLSSSNEHQLVQYSGAFDPTLPELSNSDLVPCDFRTHPESTGAQHEAFDEPSPDLLLSRRPAYKPPRDTFTRDLQLEATSVAPRPPISPYWCNSMPISTNLLKYSDERQLANEITVKVESKAEQGIFVQPAPAIARITYDRGVVDNQENGVQENLNYEKARPTFQEPPFPPSSQGLVWPIHPEHDQNLLSACQYSRQASHENTNGTPDSKSKPRKPFGEDKRQETSRTRDIGACVRCKMQRVRCRPNPANLDGPCIPCLQVASNPSKKVIHHIGCHRYKLQEITIFRTSPTPVNPKRWQNAQVREVITYGEPIYVKLKQGFEKPFVIRVSAFMPLKDDETNRAGRDPNTGVEYNEPLGLFALKRAHDVIDDYRAYIKDTWYREFADKCAKPENPQCAADGIVADVYNLGLRHLDNLPIGPNWDMFRSSADWDPKTVSERSFMQGALMMCFVLRQALGHSWIDPEGLDPEQWPRHEKFAPLQGLPGTPRMIVSQLDCIRISCVLRPLAKPLLKVLTSWIAERRHDRWLSIFHASFIFLREIALATYDAYSHAKRKKSYNPKDPKPNHHYIIAEMHESANVVLAHWHYFNCSINLETLDEAARSKSPLRRLTPEQFQTVRCLWVRMRLWKAGRPQYSAPDEHRRNLFSNDLGFKWCHPLYFAAQMFEPSWSPLEVFTG